MVTAAAAAVAPAPEELAWKDEWVKQNLLAEKGGWPFSFTYDGKSSTEWLPAWERKAAQAALDDRRIEHVLTWTDAQTGLEVRCRAIEYRDFPVVEWTVYFKNGGRANTPILADIQGLDVSFRQEGQEPFVLRTIRGDDYSASSYDPLVIPLGEGARHRLASVGGRPTNGAFPYFNLGWEDRGVLAVLGWPGQWAARFECTQRQNLRVVGGQERTKLKLLPGEEIRAPLALLMFWKGRDLFRPQNLWRRFYRRDVLPHPNGKPPAPMAQIQVASGLAAGNDQALFDITKSYQNLGVQVDLCWLDAGWYPCRGDWPSTGTWEIDAKRYPRGFKPFTDSIHAQGLKFILWFEPERVGDRNSWLAKQHPDWLLNGTLLNLGHPPALAWAIEHFDALVKAQGVDIYRQDFNMDPLEHWRRNDAPDRQGVTENLHVQGYLAYWDALLKRNPGLLIDSCASGGRRNDLETMRRSVPLLRSDYQAPSNPNVVEANQSQTHGLSSWLPYYGTGSYSNERYWARSFYMAGFGFGADPAGAQAYAECRKIAPLMLGDYYPLTPHAGGNDLGAWIAWQFDRPEQGDGVVQAFRRPKAKDGELRLKLHGLDPEAVYVLEDFDKTGTVKVSGRELLGTGLPVKLPARGSAVLLYSRAKTLSALITADALGGELPLPIRFHGQHSYCPDGKIVSCEWDFGDGATANGMVADHTYTRAGTYTARLTVKDGQGHADTASVAIAVTPVDTLAPALVAVVAPGPDRIRVTFNKPVQQADAEALSNYAVDRGIQVHSASLGLDLKTVTLGTAPLSDGVDYGITVKNVRDRARKPNVMAEGSRQPFRYLGLYAWWRLDEGEGNRAADSSGNGMDARPSGSSPGFEWTTSAGRPALNFNGVNASAEVNTALADLRLPFSFAFWVNPAATQVEHADILGNHEGHFGMVMQQEGKKNNLFAFGYGDGKQGYSPGAVQLAAGEWQHVAVVCNGEKAVCYVNGAEKCAGPAQGAFVPNPNLNFRLGQGYKEGRFFHGLLRDVRLYRKALTGQEVVELSREAEAKPNRK